MEDDRLIGEQAGSARLVDGEEWWCLSLDVIEYGVGDVDHNWQLIHNEFSVEADCLSLDVFISATGCDEEIGDQVDYLHPYGLFIHCHEEYYIRH